MNPRIFKNASAIILAAFLLPVLFLQPALAKPNTLNRNEIPDEYKWNLSDIYPDWNSWEADMAKTEKLIDQYGAFKGTLDQGPENLWKAYQMSDEIGELISKVYRFAGLHSVTDTRDNDMSAKFQRAQLLDSKFESSRAWFNPELLKIPWETMKMWLDEDTGLAPYRFGIENLYRMQAHVLDDKTEQALAYFNRFYGSPGSIYGELTSSDIDYGDVVISTGDTITATETSTFALLRSSHVQADRAKVFKALYDVYQSDINTYSAIYAAILQRDWARAQARHYGSCLEASLAGNDIPEQVFTSLLDAVKAGNGPMKRYIALRKKALGLDSYHLYDGFAPLVDFNRQYDYNEIKSWIVDAVAPLGKDYQSMMKRFFNGGWVDVYENEGKPGGAFSADVYGVHPYVLLNYDETLEEVFTVAHEAGHSLHSILANETQPYATSDYTTFIAEIASTMNENLFLDYMLKKSDDPMERVALLQQALDNIAGTFYKQTFFADFEYRAHKMVEQGEPITADGLRSLYAELLKEYYGDELEVEDIYYSYWTRISHFFESPYYVFKYATSFSASAQLAEEIKSDNKEIREKARQKYLTLLKAGGSNYPMELLKEADVDMTDPQTYQAIIDEFARLVSQLERELSLLGRI